MESVSGRAVGVFDLRGGAAFYTNRGGKCAAGNVRTGKWVTELERCGHRTAEREGRSSHFPDPCWQGPTSFWARTSTFFHSLPRIKRY